MNAVLLDFGRGELKLISILEILGEEFYFIIIALWFIGYACRRTPFIPDWLVSWILMGLGVFISCILYGWNINSAVNGIIAAAVALFGQHLIKKIVKNKEGS